MKITVKRFQDNGNTTLSLIYIDGSFQCYGLEDEERKEKLTGETRVPEGVYKVKLRTEGGKHQKYLDKFGADHRGMLCVYNAPDYKIVTECMSFQYVLIHIGNTDKDTAGCLLVGEKIDNKDTIFGSTPAYIKLYEKVSKALVSGYDVEIEYIKDY